MQNIGDFPKAKKKAIAIFVDLTAGIAYKLGFNYKLLRFLLDKYMVRIIMKLVWNRSFDLIYGDTKKNSLRRHRNGVSPGSVLILLLLNMYTYNLLSAISKL